MESVRFHFGVSRKCSVSSFLSSPRGCGKYCKWSFSAWGRVWGAFVSLLSSSSPREKKRRRKKKILKGRKKEAKEKESVSREFVGWLLGFGSRPCAERLIVWLELRDLAVQATARAVRTLHDAQRHGGLLALAGSQLHFNWESARDSITWYGQLLLEIHTVWPRFKLSCVSGISWTGAPPVDKVETLGRRFSAAVWQSRWLDRQLSVLSKRPTTGFSSLPHFAIWFYSA